MNSIEELAYKMFSDSQRMYVNNKEPHSFFDGYSGVCMHSAFGCGSKMFQSGVDVVWKCCQGSFKVASKMFES